MLLKISGIFFVALAFIGAFLPLLPTTPFLLVAATCFAKSSPRMHKMLLANKVFGPMIYHWEQSRSIPKRAKVLALSSIIIASLWSCYILPTIWLKVLVVALVVWPFVFLWRLPVSDGNTVMPLPPENIEKKVTPKNN
ncbi:MAG: YbaN family protein [Cognaticolwellia sp.]